MFIIQEKLEPIICDNESDESFEKRGGGRWKKRLNMFYNKLKGNQNMIWKIKIKD